ncbi:MAG: gamma carbonic anhydrase family protein [Acidobacteria bacterium]|nr:gamma carbonic anhydrase family protein [Acidobacteriota bacterium]
MIRPYKGKNPVIDETAYIDPQSAVIGEVTIGKHSSVWPFASVRGDIHYIKIGDYSNIQDGTSVHVTPETAPVNIGDYVTVGHNVTLHGCTIGNNCLIGMGAILLDGSVVEDGALVAAGALVPEGKTIPAGYLAIGVPAKPFRKLTEKELEAMKNNAMEYVEMAEEHKKVIEEMEI